jgi:hypothetical protein
MSDNEYGYMDGSPGAQIYEAMKLVHLKESVEYETIREWWAEEEGGSWHIGHPDSADRMALIYIIEAARSLCGMDKADAIRLLELTLKELQDG